MCIRDRNTYVLNVTRVFQVPITVTTNPPGASVFFNNRLIGRTPIEAVSYTHLDVYKRQEKDGVLSVLEKMVLP